MRCDELDELEEGLIIPGTKPKPYNNYTQRIAKTFHLSSGRHCVIKPSITANIPATHYVLVFPEEQGEASEEEQAEMAGISLLEARTLSRRLYGDPECYSISKNGKHTGSVPEIIHFHLYLFKSREEKISFYYRNLLEARREALKEQMS